ncbi:hypothetical protein [Dietzia maris]|uniref:Neutral/alkaline non-lysosomal ceramidase N-terminal domain-containing protein n=1 Tax=Dietzia maris TaxID=37915 RepID=A0ABT8H4U4_9ACTN|nr:hypothetical protein [Dietzia maris]MDN4507488.1 hypothetical protein [Dietzia maris]
MGVLGAAGVVDISPDVPCALGSSRYPGQKHLSVDARIEANVVYLLRPDGSQILVVSIDALYVDAEFVKLLGLRTGLDPSSVFVFASHTHQAPMLDRTKPKLGEVNPLHYASVVKSVSDCACKLIASNLSPVFLTIMGNRQGDHSVNRRRVIKGVARLAPFPGGPRDETIAGFRLSSESGEVIAVFWNYACHPVGFPNERAVSPHFPGVVRDLIRRRVGGSATPVLFVQGFSADTKPKVTAVPSRASDLARRILRGPLFYAMSVASYLSWTDSLASEVANSVEKLSAKETGSLVDIRTKNKYVPRSKFVRSDVGSETTRFSLLQFVGERTSSVIVGVGAEVPSSLAPFVRGLLEGSSSVLLGGCFDETYGYLQTEDMLSLGGYEVDGFLAPFSLDSVNVGAEATFRSSIAELASRVFD